MATNTAKKIKNEHKRKIRIITFPKKRELIKDLISLFTSGPFLLFVVIVLIVLTINLRVQIYDIKNEINKADKTLLQLHSKNAVLNNEFETMFSYKELEKFAEEVGMQKKSRSQVHYITTNTKDYSEIIRKEN